MGFVKFIVIFALWISLLFSSYSVANSSICILLKHDMNEYKNSKNHPIYRRAKRDYAQMCIQSKQSQTATTEISKTSVDVTSETTEPHTASQISSTTVDVYKTTDVNKTTDALTNKQTTQSLEQTESVKPSPIKQTQPSSKPKPKPIPIPMQWQNQPADFNGLLEAMRVPLLMTLAVLIGMFIYVRYIRTRIKEFKDRAHNIKNDIAIIGSNLTKNKKSEVSQK
jgi:pilus assembly protein FimV